MPPRQLVAKILEVFRGQVSGGGADFDCEPRPDDARSLPLPLLLHAQALDLRFYHLAQTFGHADNDLLQRKTQLPAAAVARNHPALGKMLKRCGHEQRIPRRVSMH